jgi:putative nucleotidyltransferase with HDIG domain
MTLEALSAALDAREDQTGDHSRRVSRISILLAEALHIPPEECEHLERAALLHDIGKIGIPDQVLLKPGKLTEEEWALMRQHPEIGFRILRGIPFLQPAAEVVLAHHEQWNGSGYPRGLSGSEIPVGARLFTVADTFDAITSDRPYRKAASADRAFAEIVRCSGTQFDPWVVEAMQALGVARLEQLLAPADPKTG